MSRGIYMTETVTATATATIEAELERLTSLKRPNQKKILAAYDAVSYIADELVRPEEEGGEIPADFCGYGGHSLATESLLVRAGKLIYVSSHRNWRESYWLNVAPDEAKMVCYRGGSGEYIINLKINNAELLNLLISFSAALKRQIADETKIEVGLIDTLSKLQM